MDTKLRKFLTIGQLGQQADVSIDTIRLYEQRGLLPKPPRTAAGYRLYTIETIERLNFIRRSKKLGFTLEEIILLLKLQDTRGAKDEVRAITRSKLLQIEMKINDRGGGGEVWGAGAREGRGAGKGRGWGIIDALSAGKSIESGMEKQVKNRKKDAS